MPSAELPYPRPPLALIATGQEWTSLSVITIFSPRGYATLRVPTGEQVLQRVREAAVDLIIVDRQLRDMPGAELAARLREQGHAIPLVVLSTEPWEREEKLAALQSGAWDVCVLPMDGEELFLRVDTWVRSKLQGDASTQAGLLDPETGLYNLQGLLRRISEIGASAMRYRRPMACVVVEAQQVSGTSERRAAMAAGELATMLREAGRASDTIGRLSQTEFVVMAPDTDINGVRGMVERLRRAAESTALVEQPDMRMRFGCCAVANMREAAVAPSDLLIRATEALRQDGFPADEPLRFYDMVNVAAN
jgi:two-component system, cell cycle response regulator